MKTILCYGDSNTYGYNPYNGLRYPKKERWTTILGEYLKGDYEVIAEGLNGRTTAFDRDNEDSRNGLKHLKPIFNSHRPIDILVFMLGTNDCNKQLKLTPNMICDGMEQLIVEAKKVANEKQGFIPKIIVVTPAAILGDYKDSPFIDELDEEAIYKSHQLSSLYKELATKENCINLDCTNCLEVSPLDCEHLTKKGHQKLAELLAGIINNENNN